MNVIILGSGGCVSTPRACCNCRVCTEARQKGFPYARTGCSQINFVKGVLEKIELSPKGEWF